MPDKPRGQPRLYKRMQALILQDLPNLEVLRIVRLEFPQHRPSPEQVRFERGNMRRRHKDKNVPTSVEARRAWQVKRSKE